MGDDYDIDYEGTRKPCVWVTHSAVEAAGYCSGTYLGNGYWFQVMVCVDKAFVEGHPGTTKKLGSSLKQTRIATPFVEICGIAFRPFRVKAGKKDPHGTSASQVMHGHQFISKDGCTSTSWHPWMEASPIDPRIIKITSGTMGSDPIEFAGLTTPGHDSSSQATWGAERDGHGPGGQCSQDSQR